MRISIGLGLAAALLAAATAVRSELKQAAWPNHEIQLEAVEEGVEPPVVTALALQPGGKLMASAGDDHLLRVWNRDTGEMVTRLDGHIDWVRSVAFTPDGSELITAGNDRRIYRWNVNDQWQRTLLAEHDQAVVAVAIHPEGDRLAVVGFDGTMHIYNMAGETLATWGCPCKDMRTVVYSPDGKSIAAAGRNGKIRIWNAADGQERVTVEGHRQRIRALLFTPDGTRLISAGEDRLIKGWNPTTGDELFTLSSAPSKVQSLAMFGDTKLASAGSDNRIRLWDLDSLTSGEYLHGHTGSIVAMQSDGDVLISGAYDATVRVWQVTADDPATTATIPVKVEDQPDTIFNQPVSTQPVAPEPETPIYQPAADRFPATDSGYQPSGSTYQPSGSRYQPVGND